MASTVIKTNGRKTILVTGAGGYIGTHCVLEMLLENYNVIAVDNYVNTTKNDMKEGPSMPKSLVKVQELTGKYLIFHEADIRNKASLRTVFSKYKIDCVLHIAALKSVAESCKKPLQYYANNVGGSVHLLEVMEEYDVKRIVFSSSSTVFGEPLYLPIDEKHPTGQCTNPYGRTKYFLEQIITDICAADQDWNAMLLRYFNPVGAHPSGLIGEDPLGVPYNLVPFIAQVSVGRRDKLTIYGTDYPTPDGTCVRDYIHIMDLAKGHVAALNKMFQSGNNNCGLKAYNLSTGKGASVFEVIKAFEKASGVKIPVEIAGKRQGDVPATYAQGKLAEEELGWKATKTLDQMCEDVWRWQSNNPRGYVD